MTGSPAAVPPVDPAAHRPFWSVMIPTYERTTFLEETLRSVLAQDPGPEHMQIEVVDNGSKVHDPEPLVRAVGGGRVGFFRQPGNVGLHENWNTCVARARGRWVHLLHDDDAVLPGFYAAYEALIARYPDATLVTSPSIFIDAEGTPVGQDPALVAGDGLVPSLARMLALQNPLKTPSVAIARAAYERVGGFNPALHHTADWELFFRAASAGDAIASVTPLTRYRIHPGSDTNRLVTTGRNIEELVRAIDLCFAQLPPDAQGELAPRKYVWAASVAYGCYRDLARGGLWAPSLIQARWALRLAPRARFLAAWLLASVRARLA